MSVVEEEISLPVATFKRQRVGNKVYLCRIVTETLDRVQNASTAQENPKFKVMDSRDVIVDKLNLIKSFDVRILNALTSEEGIEKEIIETCDFEMYVQENILVIENWLKSQKEEVRSSTLHYQLEPPNLSSININSQTRLPKQQIPSFYGDPSMFQSFWEIFDGSVNSNPNLDKISKFSYLKGLLKNKASNAILGLSLTSENYGEAVAILKSRFGDPQIVIQTNMDVLLSLPNVESCSDIHLLRKMLDVIKTTSRNLRPHNIDSNHYGPILISVIMKKLPEEFRLELSRQMPVGKWDLAKLLEVFSKELVSRERCQSIKSSETSSKNIGSQGLNSGSILHVASENHNRSPKKITFTYCRQNHP